MAHTPFFNNHLIPRADDLAVSMDLELTDRDAETLMRLANANIGSLGEERTFSFDGRSFRATLMNDDFFEEGLSIAVICENPSVQDML